MPDTPPLTRVGLLRNGARIVAASAVGSAILPAAAALAAPTPIGDDVAFLQFAAVGEFLQIALADALLAAKHLQHRREHADVAALRSQDAAHSAAITAALGADAPLSYDFAFAFPKKTLRSRASALALAARLEQVQVGVLLTGVAAVQDPETRSLIARILADDAQHETYLRSLRRGAPTRPSTALPRPLSLEAAGAIIEPFLSNT